jgi:hypothetical protein
MLATVLLPLPLPITVRVAVVVAVEVPPVPLVRLSDDAIPAVVRAPLLPPLPLLLPLLPPLLPLLLPLMFLFEDDDDDPALGAAPKLPKDGVVEAATGACGATLAAAVAGDAGVLGRALLAVVVLFAAATVDDAATAGATAAVDGVAVEGADVFQANVVEGIDDVPPKLNDEDDAVDGDEVPNTKGVVVAEMLPNKPVPPPLTALAALAALAPVPVPAPVVDADAIGVDVPHDRLVGSHDDDEAVLLLPQLLNVYADDASVLAGDATDVVGRDILPKTRLIEEERSKQSNDEQDPPNKSVAQFKFE